MEKMKEFYYGFIAWHESHFILNDAGNGYTIGQYISTTMCVLYVLAMLHNLIKSDYTHRSYQITSIVVASSYIFSTIGYVALRDFVSSASSQEWETIKLQFTWVAFDSMCVLFIVWLHIGSSTKILKSTKVVLYILLLNGVAGVYIEYLTKSEYMWVFIGENDYYPNGRYRPSLSVIFYSYILIAINLMMFYFMGGKHIIRRLRGRHD